MIILERDFFYPIKISFLLFLYSLHKFLVSLTRLIYTCNVLIYSFALTYCVYSRMFFYYFFACKTDSGLSTCSLFTTEPIHILLSAVLGIEPDIRSLNTQTRTHSHTII